MLNKRYCPTAKGLKSRDHCALSSFAVAAAVTVAAAAVAVVDVDDNDNDSDSDYDYAEDDVVDGKGKLEREKKGTGEA